MFGFIYYLILVNVFLKAQKYLINTSGCKIPDYHLIIPEKKGNVSCGVRKVFAEKINDHQITFTITGYLEDCCYKFIKTQYYTDFYPPHGVEFTQCKKLTGGKTVKLISDFVYVECKNYSDVYGFVKKISNKKHKAQEQHHWNVIVLGLDRTSRKRAYSSLPSTIRYLKEEHWFDFRGYNKVALNTYPNLVQVLTGLNESIFEEACRLGMSACNHLMIWKKFKKAGYVTAYGEDSAYYPDTFYRRKGHAKAPTDHFMRPLFKAGESRVKDVVCCKKICSGEQILTYVLDFVETYKNEKFFGFFWISSFSHGYHHFLTHYDALLKTFFKALPNVQNTFIIFLSDHGMRFGIQKSHIESFYEDRLPMLFIKPPLNLDVTFPHLYSNLEINQYRLISPKDLHLTLLNLMNNTNNYINYPKIDKCPKCQSFLQKVSESRNCTGAGIPDYYCACRDLKSIAMEEYEAMYSINKLVGTVQNISRKIPTKRCKYCAQFFLEDVLRSHYFKQKNTTFYLIAFIMSPGYIGFEGMVSKNEISKRFQYEVLHPINVITKWSHNGNCAVNRNDRAFCYCGEKKGCMPRKAKLEIISNTLSKPSQDFARRVFYGSDAEKLPKLQPLGRKPKKHGKFMPLIEFDDVDESNIVKYNIPQDPLKFIREHFPVYVYGPIKL